jgi:hypothetical protein
LIILVELPPRRKSPPRRKFLEGEGRKKLFLIMCRDFLFGGGMDVF